MRVYKFEYITVILMSHQAKKEIEKQNKKDKKKKRFVHVYICI